DGELAQGEVTVCAAVKRVDHRPEAGALWPHESLPAHRKARDHQSDTRTDSLGALAPREARLDRECTPQAAGVALARVLARVVAGWRTAGFRLIHRVMDNASVNPAALQAAVLVPWREFIQVHGTPTHACWLNRAEPMGSGFHRAVLQNTELNRDAEVVSVTA